MLVGDVVAGSLAVVREIAGSGTLAVLHLRQLQRIYGGFLNGGHAGQREDFRVLPCL